MELVVATNNAGKLEEIKSMLPELTLLTLRDVGFVDPIPEPFDTFNENAFTKADTIYRYCGKPVLADDSGICISALNGAPGVFSARYAGDHATDEENVNKVLAALTGSSDRSACYKAVICVIINGRPQYFEGFCYGTIAETPAGSRGFGYDPIFLPNGYQQTFAELPQDLKNKLSHRGAAIREVVRFLRSLP